MVSVLAYGSSNPRSSPAQYRFFDLGMRITKMSEIYAAPEGRGELGLVSMYHEQFRDMLAAANLELFPCI